VQVLQALDVEVGDDVALYLPKLKRVRKVAKSDRGKAFMDTDFAYADIASNGTRDEDLKQLADETVEGRQCWVLEGRGDDAGPYGTVRLAIDQQTFVPMKVEYADKSGKPFKRYRTLKLKSFKDRVLAAESVMENLQTGSKTAMTVLKLEESALGDEAFTERALERG
jgi:negative regulator of sigma E activity